MKKIWAMCISAYIATLYVSIDAAARSKSSHHNGSLNGSGLARSSSSMESSSLSESGRPLTPAEYERLTGAISEIEKGGKGSVNINNLINLVTDAYLHDPIAGELLGYIRNKLYNELRLERIDRMRNRLENELVVGTDIEGLAAMIQDDRELATINEAVVSNMLTTLEKYYHLAPMEDVTHQLASEQQLAELIDAAAEGKLADTLTPLQFLGLVSILNNEQPDISDERRKLVDIIVIAAVNNNIKRNPTYSLFANDPRQNEILQSSEDILNEYYAEIGKQRPQARQTKKSFAQRWFARRK